MKSPQLPAYGPAIRAARQRQGLTTRALAQAAGVSQGLISQLENGLCGLSMETLTVLSATLDVAPHLLLGNPPVSPPLHLRASSPDSEMKTLAPGVQTRALACGGAQLMQGGYFTLADGTVTTHWFVHDGEDLIYVVTGTLTVEFGGGAAAVLQPGDSLYLSGQTPHRWARADGDVTALLVVAHGSHDTNDRDDEHALAPGAPPASDE